MALTVLLDPEKRKKHIAKLLELDGFPEIEEDSLSVYCGVSLTSAPDELKSDLKKRQQLLIEVVKKAGLSYYDPQIAPYSPDINLTSTPQEVYRVDSQGIVARRFFVAHHILPSTGLGVEIEKAKFYNRITVILTDKKIRVSRMQTHQVIYLSYDDFTAQQDDFVAVFNLLKQFDPGVGLNGETPVLLGFPKGGGEPVDLEQTVYNKFPQLKYTYDGRVSIIKLQAVDR